MIFNGGIPAYWWARVVNFGDLITPFLVERLSGRKAVNVRGLGIPASRVLCAAGSILQDLEPGNHIVWGSGFISPVNTRQAMPQVKALRGPLSGEVATNIGWRNPGRYGDPGLLLPFFLPSSALSGKVAVVPNHSLKASTAVNYDGAFIVDPMRELNVVAEEISGARAILSSSLHGLVVAQAYGRPWVWIRDRSGALCGGDFKFRDFFASVGIAHPPSIYVDGPLSESQIESAVRMAILASDTLVVRRQQDLIASMPDILEISRLPQA